MSILTRYYRFIVCACVCLTDKFFIPSSIFFFVWSTNFDNDWWIDSKLIVELNNGNRKKFSAIKNKLLMTESVIIGKLFFLTVILRYLLLFHSELYLFYIFFLVWYHLEWPINFLYLIQFTCIWFVFFSAFYHDDHHDDSCYSIVMKT